MSECPLSPQFGTIAVVRDPEKKQSDGGIVIPDKAVVPPWTGVVAAASPKWSKAFPAGTRVLFRAYAGTKYEEGDSAWLLIDATAVLATLSSQPVQPSPPSQPSQPSATSKETE